MIKSFIQGDGSSHGTFHLASSPKEYQPQLLNNFEFEFPDFGRLLRAGADEDTPNGYIENPEEMLKVSCKSAQRPHFTQQPIKIDRGNSVLNFAGAPTWSTMSMSFYDYIGAAPLEALMAWQNLSYTQTKDTVGSMDVIEYKRDCYLMEYTPDYRLVRRWKLYGCWIQSISGGAFDATKKNQVSEISITLVYDRAEIDLND